MLKNIMMGKVFQLNIFYPLTELAKLNNTVNNMKMELNEETILKVEQVFYSLSESKQRLNDLYNDAKYISNLIPDKILDEINNRVQEITLGETKFKHELAECLVRARSGKYNINE